MEFGNASDSTNGPAVSRLANPSTTGAEACSSIGFAGHIEHGGRGRLHAAQHAAQSGVPGCRAAARVPGLGADPMSAGRDVLTVWGLLPLAAGASVTGIPSRHAGSGVIPGQLSGWVAARSGPEKAGSQRDRQ
jgi:hypothetical protein